MVATTYDCVAEKFLSADTSIAGFARQFLTTFDSFGNLQQKAMTQMLFRLDVFLSFLLSSNKPEEWAHLGWLLQMLMSLQQFEDNDVVQIFTVFVLVGHHLL